VGVNILDAIRTLRKEKEMTFEQARDTAIRHFRLHGLFIPDSIDRMVPRQASDYPCLAVVHGCGSECTCPHQFLPGCSRCQFVKEELTMKETTMH
jgi:hypothetical protein